MMSNSNSSSSSCGAGGDLASSKYDSTDSIVNLNVGGCHFSTSLTTLTSEPASVLAKMFSKPNLAMLDQDGRFFIDRDGEVFKIILEYLRSRQLLDICGVSKNRVQVEAEFFGLDGLLKILEEKPELKKVYWVDICNSQVQSYFVKKGESTNLWTSYGPGGDSMRCVSYDELKAVNVLFREGVDKSTVNVSRLDEILSMLEKRHKIAKILSDC